jgi:hypothetical protein
MTKSSRIAIGAMLVTLCVWASQVALGWPAFGFSMAWGRWPADARLRLLALEFFAYAPLVLVASLLLARWLGIQRLRGAIICAALGIVVAAGELIFESAHYTRDAADELLRVAGYFLFGIPAGVLLIEHLRVRRSTPSA